MPIAVIRHVPFEDLGYIAEAMAHAGLELRYYDVYAGSPVPGIESLDALILMGGPMSANDNLGYLKSELKLIEDTCAAEIPVLGVCLGAQLMAKALGGRVFRNGVKEIGWSPVYWTDAASSDPLFTGIPSPQTVFHWHGETFDLPSGATWLARSDNCRNQAFRFGLNSYGLQFHAEVSPAMIEDWLGQEANCADLRGISGPIDPQANAAAQVRLASLIFGRWAAAIQIQPRRQ